jgi:hypothetical protein
MLARTSAETEIANIRRFAFSFACIIALLLFTAASFAVRKSTAEARSQAAENKGFAWEWSARIVSDQERVCSG